MLFGILVSLFAILCLILILLVLIQKGKSSMGLGNLGGGAQTLFGGSGGQDVFQKMTWILGAIFMAGSIGLSLIKKPATSALLAKIAQQKPVAVPTSKDSKTEATQNPEKIENISNKTEEQQASL